MTRVPLGSVDEKECGLKKGPWTPDEDQKLVVYIQNHGHGSWRSLPQNAGLQRCGKSCRLRWTNYLRPDIKRGRFSQEEDQMIVHLHALLGNRWSAIASHLPRRTDNEIKNYWNTHLKKRLVQMGIDPVTHKSTTTEELLLHSILPALKPTISSNLSHTSQWEIARAEAEARLSRQSTLSAVSNLRPALQQCNSSTKTSPNQGASTNFMDTWKAQVAETLRPNFGVVELDKPPTNPVNLQTFLLDWESSLQAPQAHMKQFPAYDSPIDIPDLSTGGSSELVSSHYHCEGSQRTMEESSGIFPVAAQSSERFFTSPSGFLPASRIDLESRASAGMSSMFPLSRVNSVSDSHSLSGVGSSFNYSGACADTNNQFSPTSTLNAPDRDSSNTNSPCGSSNTHSECYDILSQSYPLIHPDNVVDQSENNFVLPREQSFWSRQQVAMVESLPSEPYFFSELESASQKLPSFTVGSTPPMSHQVGVPNIPILHFNSL